jgi:hypothetical protein
LREKRHDTTLGHPEKSMNWMVCQAQRQQNLKNKCLPVPIGTATGVVNICSNSAPSHLFVLCSANYMTMCCTEDIFKTKLIINNSIA